MNSFSIRSILDLQETRRDSSPDGRAQRDVDHYSKVQSYEVGSKYKEHTNSRRVPATNSSACEGNKCGSLLLNRENILPCWSVQVIPFLTRDGFPSFQKTALLAVHFSNAFAYPCSNNLLSNGGCQCGSLF